MPGKNLVFAEFNKNNQSWGFLHLDYVPTQKPIDYRFLGGYIVVLWFYSDKQAQQMHLGDLEKAVLQYLWRHPEQDAKSVFAYFKKQRGGTLNTIQSTLDRLYKKGLLSRDKSGHAFLYRPAKSKSEFLALLINDVTRDFISDSESSLAAAFASASSDIPDAELDELASLIEQRRQQRSR